MMLILSSRIRLFLGAQLRRPADPLSLNPPSPFPSQPNQYPPTPPFSCSSWLTRHFKPSPKGSQRLCISAAPFTNCNCNCNLIPPLLRMRFFSFFFAKPSYSLQRRQRQIIRIGIKTLLTSSSSSQWQRAVLTQIHLLCFRSRLWLWRKLTPHNIILFLVQANVFVFILWGTAHPSFMINHFMVSWDNFISLRLHTLITSAFSHYRPAHLMNNMIALFCFGQTIAIIFGPTFLLKLYLGGAFSCSIFYLVHRAFVDYNRGDPGWRPSRSASLGASGAVNAIVVLNVFLFPKRMVYYFLIPLPAALLGAIIIGTDLRRVYKGDGKISGAGHLGGALVGILVCARIRKWI